MMTAKRAPRVRVPRQTPRGKFQHVLNRMSSEKGWSELSPTPTKWRFRKKNWMATVCWNTYTITFARDPKK